MKIKCRYCKSEIPDGATICPVCLRKDPMPAIGDIWLGIIFNLIGWLFAWKRLKWILRGLVYLFATLYVMEKLNL